MSRPGIDPNLVQEIDQLEDMFNNLRDQVKDAKMRRNFVQQERELINSFYEISRSEHEKILKEIEIEEQKMQENENYHNQEINAFSHKFQHLEYDHDTFIKETLDRNYTNALNKEEEIRAQRENQYLDKKSQLRREMKIQVSTYRDEVDERNRINENNYNRNKINLEEHLKKIKKQYEDDKIELEKDLDLRLKVEIHELEERKNLHINNLINAFEERMDNFKKENIDQIKENIGLIKTNDEYLRMLKNKNNESAKEVEDLKKKIEELEKDLEEAKEENLQIENRLKKYYNQKINITNMNAKVSFLTKKCEEIIKKTEEIEKKKHALIEEIKELKEKFVDAVMLFKAKTEKTNDELEKKISNLNETYTKREIQIEEFLKNVDLVADGDDNGTNNFGREMYLEMFEHIKAVLTTKTHIIKNLKYSLELATKVKNMIYLYYLFIY